MPWAIFHKPFNYDLRPKKAVCIAVQPSTEPQRHTTALIEAAVAKNAARRVQSPTVAKKRAQKGRKRAE